MRKPTANQISFPIILSKLILRCSLHYLYLYFEMITDSIINSFFLLLISNHEKYFRFMFNTFCISFNWHKLFMLKKITYFSKLPESWYPEYWISKGTDDSLYLINKITISILNMNQIQAKSSLKIIFVLCDADPIQITVSNDFLK